MSTKGNSFLESFTSKLTFTDVNHKYQFCNSVIGRGAGGGDAVALNSLNDDKGNLLTARANQLKKAREDFFFGKENEKASRPQSLAVNPDGSGGNLLDSPSSDMEASNVQRQIIKFGGAGSGSRRSSRAYSGRHSFTEGDQEELESTSPLNTGKLS